ncbi:MAG: sensor histidine kinase, partial [Zetaproteobacteria bacterium]
QEIAKQTRKIVDLIQNASVLAHLESGGELPFRDADLLQLAGAAVQEQLGAAAERGMELELRGAGPAIARVNPLIGDAFANLISNAVKYGAEGTRIVVAVEPAAESWRIAVADRGPGVPDKDKQAIFTRFTRRAKEGVKGTGLGLSIVCKIVVAHGGRAWVEDNPGGGSVFIIELPRPKS